MNTLNSKKRDEFFGRWLFLELVPEINDILNFPIVWDFEIQMLIVDKPQNGAYITPNNRPITP